MKISNYMKIKLNLAVLISLLIIVLVSFYSFSALNDFYTYKKIVSPDLELTLDRFHFFLKNELKKEWIKLTAPKPLRDEESPLKTFRITIEQSDVDTLGVNLPESGRDHFIEAYMHVSDKKNKIFKVKLRYRGDNIFHWLFTQKSLRIKLPKGDVYNMSKTFNLINPPMFLQIRDIINYQIAEELGLISPEYYPVRVFINGKYMGVYIFLSQADESLLRKHRVMPGSIYLGESSPININGIFDLFFKQQYWQKKAARNKEEKHLREDITHFIEAINDSDSKGFYDFVNTSINKSNYFSYIAIDRFTGSNHHDYGHNHKLYFDPYKGKFEPIEWDIRFWNNSNIKDESLYPFVLKVTENPIFDAQIDRILFKIIKKYSLPKLIGNYTNILGSVDKDLESDIYKDTAKSIPKLLPAPHWYSVPFTKMKLKRQMDRDINTIKGRIEFLSNLLNDTNVKYHIVNNLIYFNVSGNSPVQLRFPDDSKVVVFKIFKGKKYKSKIEEVLYSGRKRVTGGQKKHSKLFLGTDVIESTSLVYKFEINGAENIQEYVNKIIFSNDVTNSSIVAERTSYNFIDNATIIHPWMFLKNDITTVLENAINVNETLIFDKHTTVIINPNTTFIMDSNASIYFYGKVIAKGSKEKPIKFIAKDPKNPWGVVAIQGKATTGSVFEYVEFENGSTDTHNLIHYTAPFNIHDTDWFEVRHCKIGKNFVGDDAMHIAYAKGLVDNTKFIDARSDGLDIDISDVTITNNIFYNSGNDGLDIMTTTMNASNNVFIDMGDKGISVGEWSEAKVTDSFFLRTEIGLEVKDKSKVKANNLVIVNAKDKAINLYNKNNRYDEGGFLDADNIYLLGNTKVKADKRSGQKIKNRVENSLPNLQQYRWYESLQNTPYKKFIHDVELKYAQ